MIRQLVIAFAIVAFALSSQALAVKKVPISNDKSSSQVQTPDQTRQPSSRESDTSDPRASGDQQRVARDDDKMRTKTQRDNSPEAKRAPSRDNDNGERIKEKDRFVDENDDGLNDRYKKSPEKVRKKKVKSSENRRNR
jgi:hypothetical protein